MNKVTLAILSLGLACIFSCTVPEKDKPARTIGSIEVLDDELLQTVPKNASLEVLAEGFEWSEGPVWIPDGNYLLFSDIPPNRIYRWSERDSIRLYLEPSGYTETTPREGEPGSNGLLLDPSGNLVLCQHGDRRVARMEAPLDEPAAEFTTLAGSFMGKKLNSPNDACFDRKGNLYFTDPPYGLAGNTDDPAKELEFQGVYMLDRNDSLHLLTKDLSRPNGIALSPDEKTLYVANSDPEKAIWMAYDVLEDGTLSRPRVFFDATEKVGKEKGLPDGLKVNSRGYIFATGPGGVLVFNPGGEHLGTLKTTEATANCAFNEDETVLFITADMYLLRVNLVPRSGDT